MACNQNYEMVTICTYSRRGNTAKTSYDMYPIGRMRRKGRLKIAWNDDKREDLERWIKLVTEVN